MKNLPLILIGLVSLVVLGFGLSLPIRIVLFGYQPAGFQPLSSLAMCVFGAVGFVASGLSISEGKK